MSDAAFARDLMALRPSLVRYGRNLSRDPERAEDLASHAIANAWRARASFARGSALETWVRFILRNLFISEQRRKRWDGGYIADFDGFEVPSPANQESVVHVADLSRALKKIPDIQAKALLAVALCGTYEEAADDLGVAIGTIKSRVSRGRAALLGLVE